MLIKIILYERAYFKRVADKLLCVYSKVQTLSAADIYYEHKSSTSRKKNGKCH